MTPTFYSARQRVVVLTFPTADDAALWDEERALDVGDTITIEHVTGEDTS